MPTTRPSKPSLAPQFHAYAAAVFNGGWTSAGSGRPLGQQWSNIVDKHLTPAFGGLFVDQFRPSDI